MALNLILKDLKLIMDDLELVNQKIYGRNFIGQMKYGNIINSLSDGGVVILGMPSLESQKYASSASKDGHVNCKTGKDLKSLCEKYFHNVFLFSMNDEIVHTGFEKMAHYLLVLCCGIKK